MTLGRRSFLRALPAAAAMPMAAPRDLIAALNAAPGLRVAPLLPLGTPLDNERMAEMARRIGRAVDEILARAADAVPCSVEPAAIDGVVAGGSDITSFPASPSAAKGEGDLAVSSLNPDLAERCVSDGARPIFAEDRIPAAGDAAISASTGIEQSHSNEFVEHQVDDAGVAARPSAMSTDVFGARHAHEHAGSREQCLTNIGHEMPSRGYGLTP